MSMLTPLQPAVTGSRLRLIRKKKQNIDNGLKYCLPTGSVALHVPVLLRGVLVHHTLAQRTTRRLRAAYVIGMAASLHR